MDMSSYQFVNTLAQCYEANAQLQGGGVAGGRGIAGGGGHGGVGGGAGGGGQGGPAHTRAGAGA